MAEIRLAEVLRPDALKPGRHGHGVGVTVSLNHPASIVQIGPYRSRQNDVSAILAREVGVPLSDTGRRTHGEAATVLWSGPDQWLVVAHRNHTLYDRLREALAGVAAVVDQSDGRIGISLGGPRVHDALARLVGLDLDPAVFADDHTALTLLDHTGVQLWREGDGFGLFLPRSFANSLAQVIVEVAAQFGVEVR